jgi:hypothetical protein
VHYPFIHFLHYLVFQATSHWFWHFVTFFNWFIYLKVMSILMGFCFDELLNHFRKKNALNLRRREEKKMTKLNLHMQILKKKIWMFTAEKRRICEAFFSLSVSFKFSLNYPGYISKQLFMWYCMCGILSLLKHQLRSWSILFCTAKSSSQFDSLRVVI